MVAKAVVPGSSDADRDQDGIVVHVCNVIANGTGKKEARVMHQQKCNKIILKGEQYILWPKWQIITSPYMEMYRSNNLAVSR